MKSTAHGELLGTHDLPLVPYEYPAYIWDYEPSGPPYRFELHGNKVDSPLRTFESWSTLEAAVNRFVNRALPQFYPAHAFVLDSAGMAVLGYNTTPDATTVRGPYGWWFGVRAAFEVLERFHDPMECAVWEIQAKETVW